MSYLKKSKIPIITTLGILLILNISCLNTVEEPYIYPDLIGNIRFNSGSDINYKLLDICTIDDKAYITGYYDDPNDDSEEYISSIMICDISSLSSPTQESVLKIPDIEEITDITPYGNLIYIIDSQGNLHSIDFSPEEPIVETTELGTARLNELYIDNDYAYITGTHNTLGTMLYIYDLSSPSGSIVYERSFGENGGYSIEVENNTAYIGTYTGDSDTNRSGSALIIDVSNPGNPSLIGTYTSSGNSGYGIDIDVWGDYLYLANWADGLDIVNISDPTNPRHISTYNYDFAIKSIDGEENFVSVCSGWGGFFLLNVSDKSNPYQIGYIIEPTYSNFTDLYLDGSYAHIVDSGKHRYYILRVAD